MPNPLMYQEDYYVVLEVNQPEQFLTAQELLTKLKDILQQLQQSDLPRDLLPFTSVDEQAKHLLDTSCELDLEPGKYLKWYAVRLEK